jgi:hypothetical protein
MRPNQSYPHPLSPLFGSEWCVFFIDLIFGLLTMAWYVLMRAEQMTLRWLYEIEKLVAPEVEEQVCGSTQDVLFDEELPSFSGAHRTDQSNAIKPNLTSRGA